MISLVRQGGIELLEKATLAAKVEFAAIQALVGAICVLRRSLTVVARKAARRVRRFQFLASFENVRIGLDELLNAGFELLCEGSREGRVGFGHAI